MKDWKPRMKCSRYYGVQQNEKKKKKKAMCMVSQPNLHLLLNEGRYFGESQLDGTASASK